VRDVVQKAAPYVSGAAKVIGSVADKLLSVETGVAGRIVELANPDTGIDPKYKEPI
jgi:hypothetical protein